MEAPACYTSARAEAGRVRWLARHVARLVRDAAVLGLGTLEPEAAGAALEALARTHFPRGPGVVRLEVRSGPDGRPTLHGSVRELGEDPPAWSAVLAHTLHPGPRPGAGAKRSGDAAVEAARAEARGAGADEALLLDARGRLVEGSRSAILAVRADGRARLPPLARGGVASLAAGLAREACPEIEEADLDRAALAAARELVALNAVRGARPIVALDGRPVAGGRPGPWAARLADVLDADAAPARREKL